MIYSLNGTLLLAQPGMAVIECGGVGYQCNISLTTLSTLPPVGSEVRLYTYLAVREDAIDLFGFYDREELDCFKLLNSVSGVGARLALALLSDFTADRLALTIASGDAKSLTSAPGVGNKLAQRIVLELKDKMGDFGGDQSEISAAHAAAKSTGSIGEAVAALVALGYSQTDAAGALHGATEDMAVEELIKMGLKQLSRRNF
jgi:Holliday junction DNA helicase RuvA